MIYSNRSLCALLSVLMLCMLLVGCGGGGGGGEDNGGPGDLPLATIQADSQSITDFVEGQGGRDDALEAARDHAATLEGVASAQIIDGTLVVAYANGGREIWVKDAPVPTPPSDLAELQALSAKVVKQGVKQGRAKSGLRACLVNGLYDDPGFRIVQSVFTDMADVLRAMGFEQVDQYNGAQASTASLKALDGAELLVQIGHGGACTDSGGVKRYAVQTGTRWNWASFASADWLAGRIVPMNIEWGEGAARENSNVTMVAVTDLFWQSSYSGNHLDNPLLMNLACSGSKYPSYRNALFDVGMRAYTGWSEPQSAAPWTAWRMLALMADGKTLGEAYAALPNSYKTQTDDGVTSNLMVTPESEYDMLLGTACVSYPEIVISDPAPGTEFSARSCTVSGGIVPWESGMRATISVNGQSTALPVDGYGNFMQPVGLRAGANHIKVSAIGPMEHSAEVTVYGDFGNDVLYSVLSWNTDYNDIDLRLQPLTGEAAGYADCYWNNLAPWWGATLDVDDVDGYGPEHITARTIPAGRYLLYVHYFSPREQTQPAAVSVGVSTNGGEVQFFSLPAMVNRDDIWQICNIDFPSGNIQALDQYDPAGSSPLQLKFAPKVKPARTALKRLLSLTH